ncbi:hypothetical protein HDU97_001541 [Phlyctochytrium planicorne]|nr:hypothetical protein HDU97_001541 [Phlyctochytrium planicorne]
MVEVVDNLVDPIKRQKRYMIDVEGFFWPEIRDVRGTSCGFIFPDTAFFKENLEGSCRAAALLAFFQFGHCKNLKTYTVSYNPVTQAVKAVDFKEVVAAAYYNRPLYGSIFKVISKNEGEADPVTDFNHCVDRSYMTHRFGSQFVGSDFVRNRHCNVTHWETRCNHQIFERREINGTGFEEDLVERDGSDEIQEAESTTLKKCNHQLEVAPNIEENPAVNEQDPSHDSFKEVSTPFVQDYDEYDYEESWEHLLTSFGRIQQQFRFNTPASMDYRLPAIAGMRRRGPISDYKAIFDSTNQNKREHTTLVDFRGVVRPCFCALCNGDFEEKSNISRPINDLVFDFTRNELKVTPEESFESFRPESCVSCPRVDDAPGAVFKEEDGEIFRYKVDISPLSESDCFESFNHAACQCHFVRLKANATHISGYQHLSHVHLRFQEKDDQMWVYAAYGGIAAL